MFKYKVAVVQAAPHLFDKKKTIEKIGELVKEASSKRAELILFPEVFIPGYPRGLSFGTVVGSRTAEGRDLFLNYWENAIAVPSMETELLGQMAKAAKAFLVIGVTEKDTISDTLYCSLLYFSSTGELIGKHRKIKPTAAERIIWGEGDGQDLGVHNTTHGKMGGLICWENYMPLARTALYQQGIEIYLAPTADCRQSWQATLEHIACEGRCYVLGCNQYVTKDQYPESLQHELKDQPALMCSGGSVIVSPLGKVLAGPLFGEEGILYAEIDHDEIVKSKMDFDVIGHYARPDIFEFRVKNNMSNPELIEKFYTAFQNKDWQGMQECYHPEIHFSDPVFPELKGKHAKAMWHMLVSASTDLVISYSAINTSDYKGSCLWEAKYSFSRTGRKVHNKINAEFEFKDGLIVHHQDTFNLWKWSKMALGVSGVLLGWSSFMKHKIQTMAGQNLHKFIAKNSSYQ